MNAVMGFASMLEKADQPPRNREAIAAIQAASATLLRLIDDILDLSKVESGKLELRFGPVNPRALTAELQEMFAIRVDKKGVVLDVTVDPEVPDWIKTDGVRLRQILVNLIGNAVKYTERGRIQLEVLEAYLGPLGFELIQAENGAEALDLARSRFPDLILMDIGMPILDGLEATRALKFDPSTARIPIIAVTAAVIGARVEAAVRICDGYLSKPVAKGDLIRELAIHLDHKMAAVGQFDTDMAVRLLREAELC